MSKLPLCYLNWELVHRGHWYSTMQMIQLSVDADKMASTCWVGLRGWRSRRWQSSFYPNSTPTATACVVENPSYHPAICSHGATSLIFRRRHFRSLLFLLSIHPSLNSSNFILKARLQQSSWAWKEFDCYKWTWQCRQHCPVPMDYWFAIWGPPRSHECLRSALVWVGASPSNHPLIAIEFLPSCSPGGSSFLHRYRRCRIPCPDCCSLRCEDTWYLLRKLSEEWFDLLFVQVSHFTPIGIELGSKSSLDPTQLFDRLWFALESLPLSLPLVLVLLVHAPWACCLPWCCHSCHSQKIF